MKLNFKNIIIMLLVLVVVGVFIFSWVNMSTGTEIKYTEFVDEYVAQNKVEEVYVDLYVVKVRLKDGVTANNFPKRYDCTFNIPSLEWIAEIVSEHNQGKLPTDEGYIELTYSNPNAGSVWTSLSPILWMLMLGVFAYFMFRSISGSNKQAMNFSKSKARVNTNIHVRFTDVAGAEEEKEELAEIVEFLKNPRKFQMAGARIPKGVLLVGPPGTGKTLFAKAVAGEANVPFFSISGSDFVEMFVGVGASRVRDLFDDAKKNMPCIVFIDEIDAVGRQRGTGMGGGNDEREQTLNQLLVQMDGFETNSGIIIMAATNRADILDPALLRPGRFDRQIYVNMPDVRGREEIFKVHARNKKVDPEVDFRILSRLTSGFSGADIENLLNESAILAARDNRTVINMQDIYEGINKVLMGPQKKSRLVTEADKRITAYHEAGHAIVAKKSKYCDPVQEVTIIPRGQAAGYTMTRPSSDDNHTTYNKLVDNLAMSMGGRAAEEIVIQDISAGAVGDIQSATSTARKMVTEWGMSSKIGPVYFGSSGEVFLGRDYQSHNVYSENTAKAIDEEIKRFLDDAHNTAVRILTENRSILDNMVRVLLERETIYTEDVDALMDGMPADEVCRQLDKRLDEIAKSGHKSPSNQFNNLFQKDKTDSKQEPTNETKNNEQPNNQLVEENNNSKSDVEDDDSINNSEQK